MMFGKVIASCCAGLLQLLAVFGTSFVCFNLNKSVWDENGVVSSLFDMPLSLLIYMLVFFVLGFTIYAFLFGAVGSTVSRLEDINSAVQPITLLFVAAFMVVMFSLAAGSVDSPLMIVCSYLPLTSPMAMFTRIAMSVVPWYAVVISIALLIAATFGIGVLSARIYRVGVLMYGNPPKPLALLRAIMRKDA
jgi:ABC-2 type transport system permease protein